MYSFISAELLIPLKSKLTLREIKIKNAIDGKNSLKEIKSHLGLFAKDSFLKNK